MLLQTSSAPVLCRAEPQAMLYYSLWIKLLDVMQSNFSGGDECSLWMSLQETKSGEWQPVHRSAGRSDTVQSPVQLLLLAAALSLQGAGALLHTVGEASLVLL